MGQSPAWMPIFVGRLLEATAHLSAAEFGSYMLTVMRYWVEDRLPSDIKITPAVEALLLATLPRLEREKAKMLGIIEERRAAGRRGGTSKFTKRCRDARRQLLVVKRGTGTTPKSS